MAHHRKIKDDIDDDPKTGFSFISSSRVQTRTSTSPSAVQVLDAAPAVVEDVKPNEPEKVEKIDEEPEETEILQPLSEQSQLLLQICEKLETAHKDDINQIRIPPAPLSSIESTNHDKISLPVVFEEVRRDVKLGQYDLHPLLFLYHMKIWLDNVVKYWGVNCSQFTTMLRVRESYKKIRSEMIDDIKRVFSDEILVNAMLDKSIKVPAKNRKKVVERQHDEDIVNCHCGRYLEEGVMIQCQKCLDWQHVDCVGADVKDENYVCGRCDGKAVEMEIIKKDETTSDDHQCYLTLMRGDLQVRGDYKFLMLNRSIVIYLWRISSSIFSSTASSRRRCLRVA